MPRSPLPPLLGALLLAASLLLPIEARARDLVREAAAIALAQAPPAPAATPRSDDPPPTRSQVVTRKQKEEAARAAEEQRKRRDETPYYKKWWFWALTAAVVGGTMALGAWAIEPSTPPARACRVGVIGCFGDGRVQ